MNLKEGEVFLMQGSGKKPYSIKNTGGAYSCSCPAWRNQSLGIEKRTCKHIRKLRGEVEETTRIGSDLPKPTKVPDKVAPPLMLAHVWADEDPTNWWMSEKLDGVRALWDSQKKEFVSRLGNKYYAPKWFTETLPNIDLDGELWVGRKQFQKTVSIVRRQDENDEWKSVKYLVFDALGSETFEERKEKAQFVLNNIHARWLHCEKCNGFKHLKEYLKSIELLGGEGVMLRKAESLYEAGRSHSLLKVKSFLDSEGKVIGYEKGKGRHKGRVGALVVKWNNVEFSVGTGLSDFERSNPPKINEVVKFKYQELTDGGIPRFPSYLGIRED